ncbi:MAG: zinc ribbon domain-containing protein [Lachnospiraceae bacterium]|nr:zinc ribbon domain-containing protein [Lachnospiraceae bacterium]MDU2033692.1 zinc ribbon domain-containing protein [Lachnospiraceae bacterium]
MKCPKCGEEKRVRGNDSFCWKCGFPLNAAARDGNVLELRSFFLDVDSGVMLVNGKEVNNVTAFSFVLDKGKYGLSITLDNHFQAIASLNTGTKVS